MVYDAYAADCVSKQEYNDAIEEPSWFDSLFGATAEEKLKAEPLPADMIQYTWTNTVGSGLGMPTAGYYSLKTKGQKPYGA